MKRTEALKPLSREHHHALFLAKVVTDQDGGGDSVQRFVEFWQSEGKDHFRIEEEILLPGSGLPGADEDPEVARMLADHEAIRNGVARLASGDADATEVVELAELLRKHVRFEERELFPRIERNLSDDQLAGLAQAIEEAEAADG